MFAFVSAAHDAPLYNTHVILKCHY